MPIDPRSFPYRRELRPPLSENLGEHTDREYEKIENALTLIQQYLVSLEARVEALEP